MKSKFLILILGIFIFSCSQKSEEGITISGTVNNPPAEGAIELEKYGANDVQKVAEIQLNGKTFEYQLDSVDPGFYRLNFFDTQFVNLILNESDVQITVDGDSPTGQVDIEGSPEMNYVEEVKKIYSDFQQEVNRLNSKYAEANMNQDQKQMDELYGDLIGLQKKYSKKIKQEVNQMGANLAALQAVSYLDPDMDFPFMDSLSTLLVNEFPQSPDVQQFAAQVESLRSLTIGAEAPQFKLPDPEGEEISLSSFRGDYVLVDFWAAWCKPCRMENPNLVEAYKKYNEKGFEIFGVSLDQTHEPWIEAIKKDELVWKQVRDINNEAAEKYKVNAIPANFLLNEKGEIVGKNLRGPALEQKLSEIFG